jgi:hypothetical protein
VPPRYRPAHYAPGTDEITVTEDGTALVVAVGYSTTADVILRNANDPRQRLALVRRGTSPQNLLADSPATPGWAGGVQNIAVTLKAGPATGTAPADLVQAAYELAYLFYDDPTRVGKSSSSRAGASITVERDLSKIAQMAIASRAVA